MKTRVLLIVLGLATAACESPTGVGEVSRGTHDPPSTLPQEPERTDTLRLTGTVTLNGIPREAIVELGRWQSQPCPFVPYSFGCWPAATSVVEASTRTDAEGRYELSGVLATSETLSCADHRWLGVTFTDPGLQGMRAMESPGDDVCGDHELDLAFGYFGMHGVLRIDGEPAPETHLYDDHPKILIRYADGTTEEGWIVIDAGGEFRRTVTSDDFDPAVCGHYEGATLQVTLRDGRSSDPVPLHAVSEAECAVRPIIDVEVEI